MGWTKPASTPYPSKCPRRDESPGDTAQFKGHPNGAAPAAPSPRRAAARLALWRPLLAPVPLRLPGAGSGGAGSGRRAGPAPRPPTSAPRRSPAAGQAPALGAHFLPISELSDTFSGAPWLTEPQPSQTSREQQKLTPFSSRAPNL